VDAFEVLADPVRRRILELLAGGERTSGALTEAVQADFAITQPAVSAHLKVLRDNGFATVRAEGARRVYVLAAQPLATVDSWLDRFRPLPDATAQRHRAFLSQRLDALETELARGRRVRQGRGRGDRTNEERETA